ncbi:hypothetical protein M8818_004470 [Zalaria obscura]|uniref:Uncharacterized protein n=1 Tax=Zalaria obscura TaxID=2024903 RepID=A0ACC3SEB7_9PEZI
MYQWAISQHGSAMSSMAVARTANEVAIRIAMFRHADGARKSIYPEAHERARTSPARPSTASRTLHFVCEPHRQTHCLSRRLTTATQIASTAAVPTDSTEHVAQSACEPAGSGPLNYVSYIGTCTSSRRLSQVSARNVERRRHCDARSLESRQFKTCPLPSVPAHNSHVAARLTADSSWLDGRRPGAELNLLHWASVLSDPGGYGTLKYVPGSGYLPG